MSESTIEKKLDELLERFNIKEYKNRKLKELSKGNQQKVQFITAIINDPKLLILDEPFSGLDPINVQLFMDVILDLKKKGTSIIFSSHRMEHVELFCEKLVILVHGKPVLQGYLKDIKKQYRKKNIHIIGDVDTKALEQIDGVLKVTSNPEEIIVQIASDDKAQNVFKYITTCQNITKFDVEDATLNEIFIEKVGEAYEK